MPEYIDPSEQILFETFLSKIPSTYFVLFKNKSLIACGGYSLNKDQTIAGLDWGLVDKKYHANGYGTKLLKHRLSHINNQFGTINVKLDTSQKTYKFYEKFGFKIEAISKDKYGIGLDCYDMILESIDG
ncbi:MAG: GNAT family N-acetyltransferase [Candidatus Marinimicrobia bacterium]|nr:GNAT family N-acetyltransferase [Candidatus Neomarinimicrobiota bacterium]MBT3502797.1 GNAT family N-acetyltransferase [Candidatus Neomarinimicrobiota bacterium]MBT3999695.1 GNAT family N-acetyltransferase [Candidatus Neomarinimicrobiota bacterium]MBT4282464.1 GNAT family N-acetyltransferase [Candidatus Neomarinimicrobiota bacterium]MBT4956818.1 GNAT family N-acetyltransferase [Candidatus Neomarinimicrobiota bacterium]